MVLGALVNSWIPVKERVPDDKFEDSICFTVSKPNHKPYVAFGYYCCGEWADAFSGKRYSDNWVTAWMKFPAPEPYETERSDEDE